MCVEQSKTPVATTGFKVGDKVKIVKKIASFSNGWRNAWVGKMDEFVGKIGTVVRLTPFIKDVEVKMDGHLMSFGFPAEALEKVVEQPVQLESGIKVGDKVLVAYYANSPWNGLGTVKEIYPDTSNKLTYVIEFDRSYWKRGGFDRKYLTLAPVALQQNTTTATDPGLTDGPFIIEYTWSGRPDNAFSRTTNRGATGEFTDLKKAVKEAVSQEKSMGVGYTYRVRSLKTGNTYQSSIPIQTQAPVVSTTTTPALPAAPVITAQVMTQYTALQLAKTVAIDKAKQNPNKQVNMDEVQLELASKGVTPALLGNAAGTVFKGKNWTNTGVYIKSTRQGNNHRKIAVWQYTGA